MAASKIFDSMLVFVLHDSKVAVPVWICWSGKDILKILTVAIFVLFWHFIEKELKCQYNF